MQMQLAFEKIFLNVDKRRKTLLPEFRRRVFKALPIIRASQAFTTGSHTRIQVIPSMKLLLEQGISVTSHL